MYNLSGVYQVQCNECPPRYIGQSGRTFKARFKEHVGDTKNNGLYSKFAQHIIDAGHEYDTIERTMKILHIEKKIQTLNAYERLYIYDASKQGVQLNDTYAESHNPIYDAILTTYPT